MRAILKPKRAKQIYSDNDMNIMRSDNDVQTLKRNEDIQLAIDQLGAENFALREENRTLREENFALRSENRALREEIQSLRVKHAELERTLEARIAAAVAQAVAEATAPLYAQISARDNEISRLKAIIGKDSSNSSKPPSTNGLGKKVSNNREKSDRKSGGQAGHAGHALKVPTNLSELAEQGKIKLKLEDHTNGASEYVTSYTVGVEAQVVWTEHRHLPGTRVTYAQYDLSVKSLCVLLAEAEFVSLERTSEILELITNGQISPSVGAIRNFIEESASGAASRYEELSSDILNSEVVNTDETPIRSTERLEINANGKEWYETAKGKTFKIFIRVYCTLGTTFYTLNAHKGDIGVLRDGILSLFSGILCHDHDSKLYKYGKNHGTCNEHLSRDLKGLAELWNVSWAEKFRQFLYEMNEHKKNDFTSSPSPPSGCSQTAYEKFSKRWDVLVQEGAAKLAQMPVGSYSYHGLRKMITRLTNFKENHMLFLQNYAVPFTNNLAERDLRHCKTKQKVSTSFRSWKGALNYVVIWSIIASAKKQNNNILQAIAATFSVPFVCRPEV